jgi:hypothetical protein
MKKLYVFLALTIIFVMIGYAADPILGSPTLLQASLNELPEITVAGKKMKFEFGGDTWIAKVDGKNSLAGTFTSEDTSDGSIITLKQTHVYSTAKKPLVGGELGWVSTPGPNIVLEYMKGPPETLAVK